MMDIILDVFNYIISAIMISITSTWIVLLRSMYYTFTKTPSLINFENKNNQTPKVSIIIPARNEENYLGKCLDTLINQDYKNYEIIVIDDSSTDDTANIIKSYAKKCSKIIKVSAGPKPKEWMGKNWACTQGYKKATGSLLLFTDSDTTHEKNVISLAVNHLISLDLDALTAMPKILALNFIIKITLPMISTFLHTRFSALRVNDPTKKTGYFFGSFFIIKKETYEKIGTHEGVKEEIIEDAALGKKVKDLGFKMRMVDASKLIQAVWARDSTTLWHALKRLMIPIYIQSGKTALGVFIAVSFLLFMPLPFGIYAASLDYTHLAFITSMISCCIIGISGGVTAVRIKINPIYAVFWPIGSLIIVLGFLSGIISAKTDSAISWRGRNYYINGTQNPINF